MYLSKCCMFNVDINARTIQANETWLWDLFGLKNGFAAFATTAPPSH